MGSEWPIEKLGSHCKKIGSGATPRGGKSAYLDFGEFSLIRSQNVYNEGFSAGGLAFISEHQARALDGVAVHPGDVLINITGDSVARVCLAPDWVLPARVNQHVAIIRPKVESFDSRYLRYFLVSPQQQARLLSMAAVGATRNALTKRMLEDLELPLPPTAVQRSCADILAALDDRIDLLRQTNTTLEAIAQALFKSWFVDFDPVRAKAEGREPEGMDAATAALFPSEFEESELGLIPKGWSVAPFSSQFDFTMGQSPPGSTYNTNRAGTPFFQGCTDFGEVYPSHRVFCSQPTRFAHSGDVLMSVRAPVGALNIANVDCSIGRGLCAIRHKSGSTGLTHEFVKACITRIENAAGEGALFKSLSKQQLASLPIVRVERAVLDAAALFLGPLMERRLLNSQQGETLRMLRDTLLPRLISGKLCLSGTEAAVAKVPT